MIFVFLCFVVLVVIIFIMKLQQDQFKRKKEVLKMFKPLKNRSQNEFQTFSSNGLQIFGFSIENQNVFKEGYRNIVSNISESSDIQGLRVNKNVSENECFIVLFQYFDDVVKLIFRTKDFYLLGFIGKSNIYYYFSDSSITKIENTVSQQSLGYVGSYIVLGIPGHFTNANLGSYITTLVNFDGKKPIDLQKTLSTVIFSTAEAFRFKSVAIALINIIGTTRSMDSSLYELDVKNWQILSQQALNHDTQAIRKVNIAKKY